MKKLMKKLICSRCKAIIFDPETSECNYVITSSWNIRVNYDKFDLEPVKEESIQCISCGRKIPLSVIREKLGEKFVKALKKAL